MKDFQNEVYPELLEKLSQKSEYYSKTEGALNTVLVENDKVFVKTKSSEPDFREVKYDLFLKTWNILVDQKQVSQSELKKIHNIKRSAFMLIAFDLLDYVIYEKDMNSLRLV